MLPEAHGTGLRGTQQEPYYQRFCAVPGGTRRRHLRSPRHFRAGLSTVPSLAGLGSWLADPNAAGDIAPALKCRGQSVCRPWRDFIFFPLLTQDLPRIFPAGNREDVLG